MTEPFAQFDLVRLVTAVVFVGVRISAILVFAPFLGGGAIPSRVKIALAVALTALLFPLQTHIRMPHTLFGWGEAVLGETLAGLLLALVLEFVMEGVQFAGQILGLQMGFSLVNLIDPQIQVDTPVLSIFYQSVALLIFLQLNVHHWLLRGLARSFDYLPAGQFLMTPTACGELFRLAGGILLLGLQIAGPVLMATLAVDLVLGFVGKASPQLPVMMIGISVKNLVGLLVMIAALAAWPRVLERAFLEAMAGGERMLRLAH